MKGSITLRANSMSTHWNGVEGSSIDFICHTAQHTQQCQVCCAVDLKYSVDHQACASLRGRKAAHQAQVSPAQVARIRICLPLLSSPKQLQGRPTGGSTRPASQSNAIHGRESGVQILKERAQNLCYLTAACAPSGWKQSLRRQMA